jgi:tetratricopeptide (TPR) repeat protein
MLVLYIGLSSALAAPRTLVPRQQADPDARYANRENVASAREAAAIWAARLLNDPKDFEAAWKLARARYWLGGHTAEAERKTMLESGVAAARRAAELAPSRPEGHFWMAANMGALAESHGLRQGLRYRGAIKEALLTVLEIDPAFQQGSADRALGRWYFKVPGLFGGSNKKSEEHLRKSLTYNPDSTASRYFLAETLLELDRKDDARAELQRVLDAPLDPDWTPEDKEFKEKAAALLAKLTREPSRLHFSFFIFHSSFFIPAPRVSTGRTPVLTSCRAVRPAPSA